MWGVLELLHGKALKLSVQGNWRQLPEMISSRNQSNLLSHEPLGQPDSNISVDQGIFMMSKPREKKCSLTFSESTGTGFCRAPSPSPQAGEFLNWTFTDELVTAARARTCSFHLKFSTTTNKPLLSSYGNGCSVPPSPISTGKFRPTYQSWPQTPDTLGIEVTPCFTGYQHELHFPSLQTHWSNFNFQCTAIKN